MDHVGEGILVVVRGGIAPEEALRRLLPPRWWIDVNEILVRHGQRICKPLSPICSTCPAERTCPKVGVTRRR